MTDKNVVLYNNAFTDKRVAGNLAALAHGCILLDFDERADLRLVSNFATIEINKFRETDIFTQLDVFGNRIQRIHR